jgi:hypothetical protein
VETHNYGDKESSSDQSMEKIAEEETNGNVVLFKYISMYQLGQRLGVKGCDVTLLFTTPFYSSKLQPGY